MAFSTRIKDRIKRALGRAPSLATPAAASTSPLPRAAQAAAPTPPQPKRPQPSAPSVQPQAAPGTVRRARPTGTRRSPPGVAAPTQISEERKRKAVLRAKRGTLGFVLEAGGSAPLGDMHDNSERRYFVGHRGFSRLMEEMIEEGLLSYNEDEGIGTLTQAGRDWLEI